MNIAVTVKLPVGQASEKVYETSLSRNTKKVSETSLRRNTKKVSETSLRRLKKGSLRLVSVVIQNRSGRLVSVD